MFIDGAQQVEAWLTVTTAGDATALPGAAFATAAGAVLAAPGAPAEIIALRVRRGVVTVGDRLLHLAPVGGYSWESRCAAAQEATGLARRVGEFRQQMELALAEAIAAPDRLIVLDESAIRREGAALDQGIFDQVVAGAREHHALP